MPTDQDPSAAPTRRWVIAVYAAAVLVRLAVAVSFGAQPPVIADAQDYDRLAVGLLQTGSYMTTSGELSSLRPPLYPLVVAGVYFLAGEGNFVAVALLQAAISLVTMVVVHRMAAQLAGPWVGLTAAAMFGFYPSHLAFNALLLSETLFSCLFLVAVWASLRLVQGPRIGAAVLLGLALGFGALTRSILWTCAPPLLLYLLVASQSPWRLRIRDLGVTALLFAVVLAPWAWRNTRVHQTFTLVDVMGGRNVMMGNYEHTPLERSWATVTDVTGDRAWYRVLAESQPDGLNGLTQGQIDKLAMKYGIRYFFSHPVQTLQRCVVRFFNFWQLDRTIVAGLQQGLWGDVPKWGLATAVVVFSGSYVVLILGAIFGFFASRFPWRVQLLMLLWIALPCAIHTIAFAHSRYHQPLVPILAIYAAVALAAWRWPDQWSPQRAWWPTLILGSLLALGWLRELLMVDLQLFQ